MAIGADLLNRDNLSEDKIHVLDRIQKNIKNIREEAGIYDSNTKNSGLEKQIKKMPTNFISILGERGSGKTSLVLTLIEELDKFDGNIILPIIDPSMFNVTDNALGWIIYSFEDEINKLGKGINQQYYCDDDMKILKNKYNKLKEDYIESRKFYREGIAGLSEGNYEYKKINEEIIFSDMKLFKHFYNFIDVFIKAIKNKKVLMHKPGENIDNFQPLIFITFDDVDISPERGPEILNTVLNYLKHPNIVVFILGKEDTFREELFFDLWNKERIPECFKKEDVIIKEQLQLERVNRATEFIQKVFPSFYLNEIPGESIDYRLEFTPYGKLKSEKDEKVSKLYELLDNINLEIILSRNSKDVRKIFEPLFFKPRIKIYELNDIYDKLFNARKENKRNNFEGLDDYYFDFKFKQNTYKKFIEKDQNIGECMEYKEQKANYINIYNRANVYANLLFMYPRGLINFYYEIKNYTQENNISLKIHSASSFYGNTTKIKDIENNFKIISWLYSYIRKNNLDLNYNKDIYDIDNIFKIDSINKKVYINFSKIVIRAKENYVDSFNLSQQLLTFTFDSNTKFFKGTKFDFNDTQSAFIQFFYDICKQFLTEEYFSIKRDIDFSEIIFYRNIRDKLHISMINLPYFYHYYIFQNIYEICFPIILQDRRVHRNIRDRLKAFVLYALYNLKQYDLLGSILVLSEWISLKDWNQQKDELKTEVIEYYQFQYNNNISPKKERNYNDEGMRVFSIIEFINNSVEIDDKLVFEFTDYIENDTLASMYSRYVPYINSKYNIKTRISEIEYLLLYEDPRDIDKFELMMKLKNVVSKDSGDNEKWNSILEVLALIDVELVKLIIRNVCKNEKIEDNVKAFKLQNIEKIIDERITPQNINEFKKLIVLAGQSRTAISTNNDGNLAKILEQLNIKDEIKQSSAEIECEVKIIQSIFNIIANDDGLNIYSRLIQLLGSKKNGASKIATIENIIKSSNNKLENYNNISILKELTKQYYDAEDKSRFYSMKINGQLFKILQEYFVNVLSFIWNLDVEERIKISYANQIINELEKQLTQNNYNKYINTEENTNLITSIKENALESDSINIWLEENKSVLWKKEELGEARNE